MFVAGRCAGRTEGWLERGHPGDAGDVVVVDEIKLDSPKTKGFLGVLNALKANTGALIVAEGGNENLVLASRNVQNVEVTNKEGPPFVLKNAQVEGLKDK